MCTGLTERSHPPMSTRTDLHADFRAAYCAHYRCRDEKFERKVFRRALPFHAKLLSLFLGGATHPRSQQDLELIRSLGEAGSLDEFNQALDEVWSLHQLDRDPARRYLGLRISTKRLQRVFAPVASKVQRARVPEPETVPMPEVRRTPVAVPSEGRGEEVRYRAPEVAAQRLRRAIRVHAAITAGREVEDVLMAEQMSRRELDEILAEFGRLRAELAWLQSYLRERDELEGLRRGLRRSPAMTLA